MKFKVSTVVKKLNIYIYIYILTLVSQALNIKFLLRGLKNITTHLNVFFRYKYTILIKNSNLKVCNYINFLIHKKLKTTFFLEKLKHRNWIANQIKNATKLEKNN